jgi:hypothetical protein
MRSALDGICAGYDERELEVIVDFLDEVAAVGGQRRPSSPSGASAAPAGPATAP